MVKAWILLRFSLQRFAQRESSVKNTKRGPASFPAGPFAKLPELSGYYHAASAGTAGAATAAVCVIGRDRRRACQRHNCCNQEQIFHGSLLLRFRESSAA
jgi:hypothetical protein